MTALVFASPLLVLAGALQAPAPPPQAAPPDAAPLIIVKTFADGRRTSINVGPTMGGVWTATFPRIPGWVDPPNQLPVSAINFMCERTPEGIRVAVSVFRGRPHQKEDPIATVLVTTAQPVVVDQLRSVGVAPVTLTLAPLTRPAGELALPYVQVASSQIEVVDVQVMSSPVARYRVVDQATARLFKGAPLPPDRMAGLLRSSLASIKKMALGDLADFESAPRGAGTFQDWLRATIDRYRRWFDRLPASAGPGGGLAPVTWR